ncbi:hypothetical protein JMUB7535_26790 [Staphylococcus aureus]
MFSHCFFIPIGVVAYFLFFYKDDAFDEMEEKYDSCLLYTSDAADDLTRVDLGGRRIIKKPTTPYG